MLFMDRLLTNLGRSWNKDAADAAAILLSQGSGQYSLATVTQNTLYLHSTAYIEGMPDATSLSLDSYTLTELSAALRNMGYSAVVSSFVDANRQATLLMDTKDQSIAAPSELAAFTAPMWQFLYPVHRLLEVTAGNVEEAIRQMYLTTSRGTWVDYWGSFFSAYRYANEADADFIRRIYIKIFSTKTNNIAIKEALKYYSGTYADVTDYSPARFKVTISMRDYLSKRGVVHDTIMDVKGAGIDYFVLWLLEDAEDLKLYLGFLDLHGGIESALIKRPGLAHETTFYFGAGGCRGGVSSVKPSFPQKATVNCLHGLALGAGGTHSVLANILE